MDVKRLLTSRSRYSSIAMSAANCCGTDMSSRDGEIGRHATFRALCLHWHGGSSPPRGTPYL